MKRLAIFIFIFVVYFTNGTTAEFNKCKTIYRQKFPNAILGIIEYQCDGSSIPATSVLFVKNKGATNA